MVLVMKVRQCESMMSRNEGGDDRIHEVLGVSDEGRGRVEVVAEKQGDFEDEDVDGSGNQQECWEVEGVKEEVVVSC